MNAKKIEKLIALVEKSNIGELEVSYFGTRVKISKNSSISERTAPGKTPVTSAFEIQLPPAPVPAAPVKIAAEISAPVVRLAKKTVEIKSPMVGTFYRAPAPDAEPFTKTGDTISPGQVLCIIEAMKLMNEIEAEISGKIIEILAENGKPVEYNQPLFLVEPTV
jgi:acetyl-CoA carboxylase biotin carboxyl carrier protein